MEGAMRWRKPLRSFSWCSIKKHLASSGTLVISIFATSNLSTYFPNSICWMTLALFLQISPNNSVKCCNFITPPGCQRHHWAGSEVEAQTWWGLAGPRPDSMPHPRSLRGIAASSRCYCSCPCHRGASPGQWPEGHWRSQTSAASHQYEPRNSAQVHRFLKRK